MKKLDIFLFELQMEINERGTLEESWSTFFQWYCFSHVRVQISWELVRLITLIVTFHESIEKNLEVV